MNVIGLDFGSDSVRALIVNTETGKVEASEIEYYPRWQKGFYCNPAVNQYRQHPLDYIESTEKVIKNALNQCSRKIVDSIIGLSLDTTCSTSVLTNNAGTPLALLNDYQDNPNAMFILWKDHTAINEADEINDLAKKWSVDYTSYEGGIYSAEWVWAKVLHVLRVDPSIREEAYSWIEHCDWMSALLTNNLIPENVIRSRCAAGHKAMWNPLWGGLPSAEFLNKLDPLLGNFRNHLFSETYTSDKKVGTLCPEWAHKLGLPTNVVVGVGSIDCHIGAVGSGIKPNILVKTIGTSTCDIIMTEYGQTENRLVKGICGQVDGSVIPGYIGYEAGQSAFGDVFAWFKDLICWPIKAIMDNLDKDIENKVMSELSKEAKGIELTEDSIIALDWLNGRRTPDANQRLKAAIKGLSLSSSAPEIFKALVEATAFGSRAINEHLLKEGINIEGITAIGGIAKKSDYIMQTMSDVMGLPIKTTKSDQTCALGAAMYASVVSGVYKNITEAQEKMGSGYDREYLPNLKNHEIYNKLYIKYLELGKFVEDGI